MKLALELFEMKAVPTIFGLICFSNGEYHRQCSNELYELYDDNNIAQRMKGRKRSGSVMLSERMEALQL